MDTAAGKTVALIVPLWIGHHPMYFSQFTASFLRAGARVIGLCPEPEAAMAGLVKAVDGATAESLAGRVHFHRLATGKRSFFNGRFEGDPVRTFTRWKTAADTLADAEAASGLRADLVYFPYLDSYLRFLPFPAIPGFLLNRPWSGLYLRNHHHGEAPSLKKFVRLLAKGDAILRSGLCLGIGVLDERFIAAMEKPGGIRITAYPDVTQEDLPAEPYPLALDIRRRAGGRTIVGMIGLERRKGFLTVLRTAGLAREAGLPLYFVCAGMIHPEEFSESEQAEIDTIRRAITAGEIDNVYFDPAAGRIPNEADYNFLFRTFDIAWAAYEGFEGSSGTLSKAAAFEIPCLASAGECVGNRVEKYGLGVTIPEGSAEMALAGIQRLAAGKDMQEEPLIPKFAEYREQHSRERLDRILGDLLQRCC
jgi:glycosyltransferase involved in cell wall biosynthesis